MHFLVQGRAAPLPRPPRGHETLVASRRTPGPESSAAAYNVWEPPREACENLPHVRGETPQWQRSDTRKRGFLSSTYQTAEHLVQGASASVGAESTVHSDYSGDMPPFTNSTRPEKLPARPLPRGTEVDAEFPSPYPLPSLLSAVCVPCLSASTCLRNNL